MFDSVYFSKFIASTRNRMLECSYIYIPQQRVILVEGLTSNENGDTEVYSRTKYNNVQNIIENAFGLYRVLLFSVIFTWIVQTKKLPLFDPVRSWASSTQGLMRFQSPTQDSVNQSIRALNKPTLTAAGQLEGFSSMHGTFRRQVAREGLCPTCRVLVKASWWWGWLGC